VASWQPLTGNLGAYQRLVDDGMAKLAKNDITKRIWAMDHTVWKPSSAEITNRLGWLHIAEAMQDSVNRLEGFTADLRAEGYTHALLLGMGGSSLAPEVFRKTFGVSPGFLDLAVLDSTDPGAVLALADRLDLSRTLFIVATKSGGTVETLSFFKFFYNQVADTLDITNAGLHFVAITDPGSRLADIAQQYGFRDTFLNDTNIGGRYSALSFFGLVPTALLGMDLRRLLDRALQASVGCGTCVEPADNPAARLGVILGELAIAGHDKVTFSISPAIGSFGDWVEQLIAESTGKEGKGILPVVGEPLGSPDVYGNDRLFVQLRLDEDDSADAALDALEAAGHPVVRVRIHELYDLGAQVFMWEMATAIAGHLLSINPFNQPNVEAAKIQARKMVDAYTEAGELPSGEAVPPSAGALDAFLSHAQKGDPTSDSGRSYIGIQAYVQPTQETDNLLQTLRIQLRDRYKLATTVGYGPRFLHSTGQLHKGDAGNGCFVQLTADDLQDVPIPDQAGSPATTMSFGVLKLAQALGDRQALQDAGRPVIRFHLGSDVAAGLRKLIEMAP
jgi:glucose-6-phosphate isomerase